MKPFRRPDFNNKQCGGGADLIYFVIVIGLSLLAQQLLKKKPKSPVQDDKPTTLTTRGSYMTWLCGIRMVGPCFGWAGDRERRKEDSGGGKGGSTPKQDVWYEAGWHLLSAGPCNALWSITQAGNIIFVGPITNLSHPSGSTINLGKEGSFQIYWGEDTQPINAFLGASTRVNISSRWPGCCYVVWNKKRLGGSANWPVLNYELERRPTTSVLTGSSSWYDPSQVLSGLILPIDSVLASATPTVGYFVVKGNHTQLQNGFKIRVTGNSLPTGDYIVLFSQIALLNRTRIFLTTGTAGANSSGTLQTYTIDTSNGANIAHAIAELLFAPYPLGLELTTGVPEPWDIQSLEDLGAEAQTEKWRASLVAVDGESASNILANALQDHGTMLPLDTFTGKLKFQRVRQPVGILANVSSDIESDKPPEIESLHAEKTSDIIVYSFTDRDHAFSDMTIGVSEDGQISYMKHARSKVVQMASIVHFNTAAALTELRSQEELAGAGVFRLQVARAARLFIPGQAIIDSAFDEVLRVIDVTIDPLSEIVAISVFPDFYGGRKSDFITLPGGGGTPLLDTEANLEGMYLEIPEQLLTVEEMVIVTPQIRAHSQIVTSHINISRDDISYTALGTEDAFVAGGVLDAAMVATGFESIATGPTFTLEGPDIGTAIDLSADPTNFGLGRQIMVIYDATLGLEIFFVQKIVAVSGTQYRADGILRARYDTRKRAFPIGSPVFIFQNTSLTPFQDVLISPDVDLYLKANPIGTKGSFSLSNISPFFGHLYGKGLVPITPESVRATAPFRGSPVYRTGDDVTIAWGWSSASTKNTGAGFQNAGSPIGIPVLKGFFIVELLTVGLSVVSTQTLSVASVTYSAATLAAAPISNGNFNVRITHSYNGYSSGKVVYFVTHI